MTISTADWKRYINRLRRISDKAAEEMQRWVQLHGFGDTQALIDYAWALATKYGEAAATASCDMFDAVAEASGKTIPGALPAETATYGETAKAVNGTLKQGEALVPDVVGRLVKQAGADTTLQNAERYGAEFAWVPMGDTCSFCRMLASNGWQRQSKQAMKGDHAEHIHANCDCQYAVRFDGKGGVAGYDPDKYKAEYDAAEGTTWQEKLNSMRREQYKANKDEINAQKRIAYNERVRKGKLPNVDLEEYGLSFTDNTKPYYPPDTIMAGKGCKTGRKIDDIDRLVEAYSEFNAGAEEWSKRKARYEVEDIYGQIHEIEVHWYQHPNVGKCEDKIKLDDYGNPFVDEWDL